MENTTRNYIIDSLMRALIKSKFSIAYTYLKIIENTYRPEKDVNGNLIKRIIPVMKNDIIYGKLVLSNKPKLVLYKNYREEYAPCNMFGEYNYSSHIITLFKNDLISDKYFGFSYKDFKSEIKNIRASIINNINYYPNKNIPLYIQNWLIHKFNTYYILKVLPQTSFLVENFIIENFYNFHMDFFKMKCTVISSSEETDLW